MIAICLSGCTGQQRTWVNKLLNGSNAISRFHDLTSFYPNLNESNGISSSLNYNGEISCGMGHWRSCKTWWRHQMETYSALLALCVGNSPLTSEFPSQRPVARSFDVFFDLHLTVNTRYTGDLRRHRTLYDGIVMNAVHNLSLVCDPSYISYAHTRRGAKSHGDVSLTFGELI